MDCQQTAQEALHQQFTIQLAPIREHLKRQQTGMGKRFLYLSKESNPHSMYGSMEKMLDTAKTAIHQQNLISVNI